MEDVSNNGYDDEDKNIHCALTKGLLWAVSSLSITSFNSHCNATKDSWLLFPFETGETED